jgi:thiol oxidase
MELFAYFQKLQTSNIISSEIKWAPKETLARSITASRDAAGYAVPSSAVTELRKDVSGYLEDSRAALHMSLIDAVFKDKATLEGSQLSAMKEWLTAVAECYPKVEIREQMRALASVLDSQARWEKAAYMDILNDFGIIEPGTENWKWCEELGEGVGGYPCGLWVLFHAMLANSNDGNARANLAAMHGWIVNFFGCRDCAQHFEEMWISENGEAATSHISAVVWLWKAHNLVRDRLHDDHTTSNKWQWPSVDECPDCYTEEARNGTTELRTNTFLLQQWETGFVFECVQEIYCYGSDMLECAQYWDHSQTPGGFSYWRVAFFWGISFLVCRFYGSVVYSSGDDEVRPNSHDGAIAKPKAE